MADIQQLIEEISDAMEGCACGLDGLDSTSLAGRKILHNHAAALAAKLTEQQDAMIRIVAGLAVDEFMPKTTKDIREIYVGIILDKAKDFK